MLGIKCQLRARLPTTLLSFHNTMKKIKELNGYRDKYRLLLFNYERSKNQKVKARNTMNRLCECIIEDNVPRINTLMAVHLRNGNLNLI